jgi:hypothetical protein
VEILEAGIRKLLQTNPSDTNGKLIVLSRAEVGQIPLVPSSYIIIDETDPSKPVLEFESQIYRTGYTQAPTG